MAKGKRKRVPKTVLKLPDLEQSKSAVLNSLTSASLKRSYDHAICEFIDWYCSEPRLAFKTYQPRTRRSAPRLGPMWKRRGKRTDCTMQPTKQQSADSANRGSRAEAKRITRAQGSDMRNHSTCSRVNERVFWHTPQGSEKVFAAPSPSVGGWSGS